ncbi:hypothetical protein [Pseudomonas sp. GD03944]|uniref:hypothetical protein n=1 Tax=Pseudomonas sp. GD03944 TaxID=2975409 RepID=UPI00244920D7|nr:hypothetical protein [Pseudomonas sp. GD03944]MDH1261851.1 hypothetical protein [Pseudomonas sp. GD03944]
MTSINNSMPAMVSYYSSQANAQAANANAGGSSGSEASRDPIAELRRYASQVVARSEGGLLRALHGGSAPAASSGVVPKPKPETENTTLTIPLPDVASLDRDEANKLLGQVQELIDLGLDKKVNFTGTNQGKETDSLETYRQWLQEKGGVSIYV